VGVFFSEHSVYSLCDSWAAMLLIKCNWVFLQYFDTIHWVAGRTCGSKTRSGCSSKSFLCESTDSPGLSYACMSVYLSVCVCMCVSVGLPHSVARCSALWQCQRCQAAAWVQLSSRRLRPRKSHSMVCELLMLLYGLQTIVSLWSLSVQKFKRDDFVLCVLLDWN